MDFIEAIKKIFNGNVVLFTGSGFSLSAKNIKGNKFKTAGELTKFLYLECNEANDGDLENAVDIFLEEHGEGKLIKLLTEEFSVSEISDELKIYGELPWKRIYTTNYDDVIETLYRSNNKKISSVSLSDKPINYDKQSVCVHLNGSISNLSTDTLNSEFKLTNVSYLTQTFLESDWIDLFKLDLATSDAIIFVGFSMRYDLDIKRLIYATDELKEKTFFVVSENESSSNLRLLKKFGTPMPIGICKFSKMIKDKRTQHIPLKITNHYFSFKQIETDPKQSLPIIKDSDTLDLFVNGNFNERLIQNSLQLPEKFLYYVYRNKFDSIIDGIKKGEKNFVIHSDIGNGKTLFLNGLKFSLHQKGFKVYEYYKYFAPVYRELEAICQKGDENTVIIIDNYSIDWQLIDVIKLHRKDLILIMSERSLLYDVNATKLEPLIGDFKVFDINLLDRIEIEQLVDIFDSYGLWQEIAIWNRDKKIFHIEFTCNKEFRSVLLKILDSPDILKRFEKTISDIRQRKGYYDALVFILISNIYGFSLDLEKLAYIVGYDVVNSSSFENNIQVKEFVDFRRGNINVKSSVLSLVILSKIVDSYILVDIIIKIFLKLDNHINYKPYKNILKSFVSFSSLQRILNKDDRSYKHNILRFFESIKNTEFCKKNPHFWLQYAIEKLSERDYSTARKYFNTAYSFANQLDGYDPYQIDNHYARYILESVVENDNHDGIIKDFLIAHNILIDPVHDKVVKYYPYRVAQRYLPFYEKFFAKMNKNDRDIFINSCMEMIKKIENFVSKNEKYANRREVRKAKENLYYIIAEANK